MPGKMTILVGHALDRLRELPDESVHCCVTSPPYFGLRAYGTEPQVWGGGDPACEHEWISEFVKPQSGGTGLVSTKQVSNKGTQGDSQIPKERGFCSRCGAWRCELGLEPTPELYVEHVVAVFREVWRVLRADGTLWLNVGDSYSSGGIKPKDLIGVPWMLAFALRADGWYLRSDIIWSKPNPMPESVTDRPTKSHEYVFLLSKSERYYYDHVAIAEPALTPDNRKPFAPGQRDSRGNGHDRGGGGQRTNGVRDPSTRNRRSVWEIATYPYVEAHFATFPPALIEPCVLAGCPEDGIVLDPFGGAGTTGMVADRLGRSSILIELNPEYAEMARKRMVRDVGPFMRPEIVVSK